MYKIILLLFLLSANMAIGQSADFNAAAAAFENDNTTSALSILAQLETKVGANPKIESLRALCYSNSGDNKKAYNSVLRYFKLAGRSNNAPGNADMVALEQSVRNALETELRQKQRELENKRNSENEIIVEKQQNNMERVYARAKEASETLLKNKSDQYVQGYLGSGAAINSNEIRMLADNVDPNITSRLISEVLATINKTLVANPGKARELSCSYCKNKGYEGKVKESLYNYLDNSFKYNNENKKFTATVFYSYKNWSSTNGEMRPFYQEAKPESVVNATLKGVMTFDIEECYANALNGSCKTLVVLVDNKRYMKLNVGGGTPVIELLKQQFLRLNQLVSGN